MVDLFAFLFCMSKGTGTTQKKILLLLLGGVALGLSGSPARYFRILREIAEDWKEIDRWALKRAVASLYQSKLIAGKSNKDGTYTLILNEQGKKRALAYRIETMTVKKPPIWDKRWRIVMFDIPERLRKSRDVLRVHLLGLGFYELQKSVFVHPYPCTDEIEYLIEFYGLRKYVRSALALSLDNELHVKQRFRMGG